MKRLVLFIAISLISITSFSQISPVNFGIHGGVMNTKIDVKSLGDNVDNIKESSKNGFMIGAFARINLGKLYIEPALNYSKRESEVSFKANGNAYTGKLKYASVDIPVMLGYKIIKLPLLKVRIFGGPVASFSTDPLKLKDLGNITEEPVAQDIADLDASKANWNIKLGAGIDLWKLSLDLDFERGLSYFEKDYIEKPQMFNITLGFRIF